MIDTIRLRFHGILDMKPGVLAEIRNANKVEMLPVIPEHHQLYIRMLKYKGKYFSMVKVYNKTKETLETLNESEYLEAENHKEYYHSYNRNVMRFIDEGQVKYHNMKTNGKYRVPSSTSDVTFQINEKGGYIDIEFSVPKYIYGHNLEIGRASCRVRV